MLLLPQRCLPCLLACAPRCAAACLRAVTAAWHPVPPVPQRACSGRTVISPDPNLRVDQVCVPRLMATTLTYPERITEHNMDKLRLRVLNGERWGVCVCLLLFPWDALTARCSRGFLRCHRLSRGAFICPEQLAGRACSNMNTQHEHAT